MTLPALIAIAAGILVEILLLWENADRQMTGESSSGLLAPRLSRLQEWIGLTSLIAIFLVLVFQATGFDPGYPVLDGISGAIMFVSFSFLFVFGMVAPRLMPRVNEQTVVIVNLLILPGLWPQIAENGVLMAALLIPSAAALALAFSRRILHPILKSFLYLWFLVCLLLLTAQNNFDLFFVSGAANAANPLEDGIAGAAGIFLLLHAIFLVRFFLMLSALVLPHNRHYLIRSLPRLFSDEQMPRLRFLAVLGLTAALLLANQLSGFAPQLVLTNVLILAAVQLLDRFPTHT